MEKDEEAENKTSQLLDVDGGKKKRKELIFSDMSIHS